MVTNQHPGWGVDPKYDHFRDGNDTDSNPKGCMIRRLFGRAIYIYRNSMVEIALYYRLYVSDVEVLPPAMLQLESVSKVFRALTTKKPSEKSPFFEGWV